MSGFARGLLPLAVLVCALLGAAGCGARTVESDGLPVTASIFPLADFARRIGGDRVNVQTLIQGGGDAHDFQPAPRDLTRLARARLFVYNGGGFEPWAARVIRQLPSDAVAVDTTAGLVLGGDGGTDPHVWLDPLLAARQVDAIRRGLIRADPAGRTVYDANAAALAGELAALHEEFAAALGRCRRREFITAHAAFGHLARRYGLTMVPLSGLSSDAEPSPARLAAVVRLARQRGIAVVYTDPLEPSRAAEAVAREAGLPLSILYTLEGLTAEQSRRGDSYLTVMHENLRALIQGLACR